MDYAKEENNQTYDFEGNQRTNTLLSDTSLESPPDNPQTKSVSNRYEAVEVDDFNYRPISTMTKLEIQAELEELKTKISQYRALMLMVSLNSGWSMYRANVETFYLMDVLKVNGTVFNEFDANTDIPWMVKPLWGFLSDSFFIFGYRLKSHIIAMSVLTIFSSVLLIFDPNPGYGMFTFVNMINSTATAYIDTMAEGMSAVITKSFARVKALEAVTSGNENKEDDSMTAYGSYNAVRTFFRGLMAFIGGLLAQKTSLAVTGAILAFFPTILLLYVLFVFKEERNTVFFSGCDHFKKGFYFTFKALFYPTVIFPLLFNLLSDIPPGPAVYYFYMLLGQGGWTFDMFVLNGFITSLLTAVILMWFVNAVKHISFVNLQLYGFTLDAATVIAYSIILYCQDFSPLTFSVIWFAINLLGGFGGDLRMASLVGRISKYLPEGFESTGVTLIISSFSGVAVISRYISAPFLGQYHIGPGYYDRIKAPQIWAIISQIVFVVLSPLFLMWG